MKPIGQDKPEASSRCSCDSVVRAPMAPQEIVSAVYYRASSKACQQLVKLVLLLFRAPMPPQEMKHALLAAGMLY